MSKRILQVFAVMLVAILLIAQQPVSVSNIPHVIADTGSVTTADITKVAGATISQGHGTAATAIRVELPTDGTGTVGLNAGTNIVGKFGIDQTTDVTTNGVEVAPTAAAAAGITPVVSAAVESSHILKASAGNLYSVYVTTGATAGYLMVFNATSAPVDGAVTPNECAYVPANSTTSVSYLPGPVGVYSTGITAVFSSTGCFTKTASATAYFHGLVK
jgi:hypothetical protein